MTKFESQASINAWQKKTFPNATEDGIKNHLREEFQEFLDSETPQDRLTEAADIIILLFGWAGKCNFDLMCAVDEKMKINRNRRWNIQSDGTGRHT